ncbi:MAG: hypothetical protein KHX29_00075, partial [Prevotella buccalis]|nr:hypothetical protein [Hoylesella buccalis]
MAKQLGRRIPGLASKVGTGRSTGIVQTSASVHPLEPAWVNAAPYRLPEQITPHFDVAEFARTHRYRLLRRSGSAPCFFDKHNNQFIAMRDATGRYHLYQSYVEDGARYVKDPAGNHVDFMVVPGDAKSWKPRFERNAVGGGSVLGALRSLTPEQQRDV